MQKNVERLVFWVTLVALIVGMNCLYFTCWAPHNEAERPSIKVDSIGDAVFLRYAGSRGSYYLEGLGDSGWFRYADGLFVFFDPMYSVTETGESYNIVNSNGETVGTVKLKKQETVPADRLEIDAATHNAELVKVPATCTSLRVYTSVPEGERPISIQVEQRDTPLEIIFEDVTLTAPDFCPVLYSVSQAPVNVKVKGKVTLKGGKNPFTAADISGADRLLDTLDTAANAYCVVMISAVGGAASIYKGAEYYSEMFTGISALQLAVMENSWNKVENLFNGSDGATGLDGIPAVQLVGDLSVTGEEGARLYLWGGEGARGGNGLGGFINTTRGGKGGNGASALICDRLFNGLGFNLYTQAGAGGVGGSGGKNIVGEEGPMGNYGGNLEEKVLISQTEIDWTRVQ